MHAGINSQILHVLRKNDFHTWICDMFSSTNSHLQVDKTAFEIVSFTSWYIWKSRCAKLFDNVRVNESGTIAIILSEVRDWKLSTKSVANNLNDTVPTIPK